MYTLGYDIGTRFIKVCLLKDGIIVRHAMTMPGYDISNSIKQLTGNVLKEEKINLKKVSHTAATGFGYKFVKKARLKTTTAHCLAKGTYALDNSITRIIDVGGLFITIAEIGPGGILLDSIENEKCAAGSGKFIETITNAVHLPFEELSEEINKSREPLAITNNCAVFAESEFITQINQGGRRADILMGLVNSLVSKVETMARKSNNPGPTAITGGVSKINIFRKLLEERLGMRIETLSCGAQLLSAYGAGLVAAEKV
ncbi:MAG: hypothetical protein GY754_07820 [bacterium]|nr:hypothetical protein [bacterium]